MIVHIGNDEVLRNRDIIAIFSSSLCKMDAAKRGNVSFACGNSCAAEPCKSVILAQVNGEAKIFASSISVNTLKKRASAAT